MDEGPGPWLSDITIRQRAHEQFDQVLTPVQQYWLSLYMLEIQEKGYGKIELIWWNGRVDKIWAGLSRKMEQLPVPTLVD